MQDLAAGRQGRIAELGTDLSQVTFERGEGQIKVELRPVRSRTVRRGRIAIEMGLGLEKLGVDQRGEQQPRVEHVGRQPAGPHQAVVDAWHAQSVGGKPSKKQRPIGLGEFVSMSSQGGEHLAGCLAEFAPKHFEPRVMSSDGQGGQQTEVLCRQRRQRANGPMIATTFPRITQAALELVGVLSQIVQ